MLPALPLLLLLFVPMPLLAQPASPLVIPPSQESTVVYGPDGARYDTLRTPDGGSVTYGQQGEAYRTIPTPDGGTVTYGPQGQSWRVLPGPSAQGLHQPR
jgi:hypothetical protein